MENKDSIERRKGYVRYVKTYLAEHVESTIAGKGFNSLESLLSRERNIKDFRDKGSVKSVYSALMERKTPTDKTLAELQKTFNISFAFKDFEDEIFGKNPEYLRYLIPFADAVSDIPPTLEWKGESFAENDNDTNTSSDTSSPIEISEQQFGVKKEPDAHSTWHKIKWPLCGVVFFAAISFVMLMINHLPSSKKTDFSINVDDNANLSDYEKERLVHGFNDNTTGDQDCPTISIADLNQHSSTVNGCWQTRIINIDSQRLINVIVYCHNTDENVGKNLRIKLRQYNFSRYNRTIFSATVVNNTNGDTVGVGYAEASYSVPKKFMFGSIYQYKDKKLEKGILLDNGEEIFSDDGLRIGNIPGYSNCPTTNGQRDAACHEQWLMISFRVVNEPSIFPEKEDFTPPERETSLKGFNDNTIGNDCPTISVTNDISKKSADGCFGARNITIDTDGNVDIFFYYHNTSVFADTNVRIKLNVIQDNLLDENNLLKKTTFRGTILLNEHDSIVGYANVFSHRPEKFTFIIAKLFASQSSIGTRLFNADQIFSIQGLHIPDILGYTDCPIAKSKINAFCHQGWIDITFDVRNR